VKDTIEWSEEHPFAEKDDYDEKYKELEKLAHPIFSKLYGGGGGGHGSSSDEEMPSHDEL